ncbi:MAG: YbhB/YbcL family Raf kinase inhibitor-like protein [Gluconacetobacter diazotrophicus]|nr:YbhB/YbcL family Raf kinase inhibitor-like protein [Gluconacetobacter diazotrophicus]
MLQNIPAAVGRALQSLRGGPDKLVSADPAFEAVPEVIQLSSTAFGQGEPIPVAHTEDGERISPPLEWIGVPPEAESLVLLIEDQDSPTPRPLVHAILADLEARDGGIEAGALPSPEHEGEPLDLGRNSFLRRAYLPPDPPPGHGVHRYAFQIFALDEVPVFDRVPGRSALVEKLKGHVIARGLLVGTYERR